MHHGGRAGLADRAAHGIHVADVAFDQRRAERRVAVPRREVVVDDDAVAGAPQRLGGVAADVAGAAGDEDGGQVSGGQWSSR